MLLPDVNVLVAAIREDTGDHEVARRWVGRAYGGSRPVVLCPPVVAGLVRVATHPRIFAVPTPVEVVWEWVRAAVGSPRHRFVSAGPRHLQLLESSCRAADARGNLVSDAVIAAIALEHGCEVVTFDGDFARFPELSWSRPA